MDEVNVYLKTQLFFPNFLANDEIYTRESMFNNDPAWNILDALEMMVERERILNFHVLSSVKGENDFYERTFPKLKVELLNTDDLALSSNDTLLSNDVSELNEWEMSGGKGILVETYWNDGNKGVWKDKARISSYLDTTLFYYQLKYLLMSLHSATAKKYFPLKSDRI